MKSAELTSELDHFTSVSGHTYLGSMSQPCCMKAPSENQRLLKMVKLLVIDGPSVLSSTCHSNGLKRLTRKSTTLTCGRQ